jgi:hypothetical protein
MRTRLLAGMTAVAISISLATVAFAADPPGSTPSGPPTPGGSGAPERQLGIGSPRPTLHGISVPLPPPSVVDPAAEDAHVDKMLGIMAVPGSGPMALDEHERGDLMYGICHGAGGGASTNPDGSVSCVDAEGEDVFDP